MKNLKFRDKVRTLLYMIGMVIEAIQSGAKDFIVKPFQAERVLEAVKKVVG